MAESKTKNKSQFKEIWDNLYSIDVSEHIEKKMNLDFLSWGKAYTLMVQTYPDFTFGTVDYDGCPYQLLPNGTANVSTWIEINGIRREMTLPVMDNKMRSTINLDSSLVNKNVWRCFVKNCAMFGLGMKLYSQMNDDIDTIGNEPDTEVGTKPEALTPQEDGYPTDQAIDDLKFQKESGVDETISNEPTVAKEKDTKESEMFMEMCLSYLKSENLSVKEIENFFPDNKDNFMRLKDEIPSEYNNLITMFKNKKKELQKGDK
tara:strand:+ start:4412 stop:5194 length:783 start_codon:yes stop_codon:yes gene_type:complete